MFTWTTNYHILPSSVNRRSVDRSVNWPEVAPSLSRTSGASQELLVGGDASSSTQRLRVNGVLLGAAPTGSTGDKNRENKRNTSKPTTSWDKKNGD